MMNTFLLIPESIQRNDITGISILNAPERFVFSLLDFISCFAVFTMKRIGYLNISIILITVPDDKIAFQISNLADTDLIVSAGQIQIDNVFQRGTITETVISVG